MKKVWGKLIAGAVALTLAFGMATALAACGGGSDPNLGVWKATKIEALGQSMDADEVFGGLSFELKSGGKATMKLENDTYNVKWKVSGNAITIEDASGTVSGTINGNTMIIDDWMGMGFTVTLVKQ
ncbi:MAG: lipocalin family protein [Coriobacteriia bacterium]|nr:lipocalin family protein [Coriobacteriia bacterium]